MTTDSSLPTGVGQILVSNSGTLTWVDLNTSTIQYHTPNEMAFYSTTGMLPIDLSQKEEKLGRTFLQLLRISK